MILLGAGFVLWRTADSLWQPAVAGTAACFLDGGRQLGRCGLKKIRWLHLTPERMKLPEQFFKRHDAKTVFIARFIFLFPSIVVNLLAGMSQMPWRIFLFYNLTGSAAYATTYTLIGYFFGKKWKLLESWLRPAALYLILAGLVIVVLSVLFRHSLFGYWARIFQKKRQGK
jgi:membrane-associated protein